MRRDEHEIEEKGAWILGCFMEVICEGFVESDGRQTSEAERANNHSDTFEIVRVKRERGRGGLSRESLFHDDLVLLRGDDNLDLGDDQAWAVQQDVPSTLGRGSEDGSAQGVQPKVDCISDHRSRLELEGSQDLETEADGIGSLVEDRSQFDAEERDALESTPKKQAGTEDTRTSTGGGVKSDRSQLDGIEKLSEAGMELCQPVILE